KSLAQVFSFSSEPAMRAYLASISGSLDALISMVAAQRASSGPPVETALTWTLRHKGVILNTLMRFREAQSLLERDPAFRDAAAGTWGPDHYFAFVLVAGNSNPRMIDLGEAASIDEAIAGVRKSLIEFGEKWQRDTSGILNEKEYEEQYRVAARRLYDLVFAAV